MRRSFSAQLAWRFSAAMALTTILLALAGYVALRVTLDRQINASLLSIASLQATSVTDDPSGEMRFQEWDLTPEEATSLRDLNRYAQVWSESGESVLRSRYLRQDLPLDSTAARQARAGKLAWVEGPFESGRIRALYYPLGRLGPNHTPHVLQVAASLDARDRTLGLVRYFQAGVVIVVTVGTFIGGSWLGQKAMRPVHEIIDQTEEIGAGTLGRRISAHAGTVEYERLVRVLNATLDRIDTSFDAQRRFTADASHELRSPLTALRGELELAVRRERDPEEYRRVIRSALEETERLSDLAENLLTLARSDAGVIEPRFVLLDLAEHVTRTVERLRGKAEEQGVALRVAETRDLVLPCDPDLFDRLVWNLVDNAIKFTTPGGKVDVRLYSSDGEAIVEVTDTGPGIRESAVDRIFERFYRGDSSHGSEDGTGLGLAIVRAIAEAHGGSVSVENRPTGGALFRAHFPTHEDPEAARSA